MILSATKIATGAVLVGGGALAGVVAAPQGTSAQSSPVAATEPVVRTVHVKRVHRRTVHEKLHHHRGRGAEAERGGNHAATSAGVATTSVQRAAAPVPAVTPQQPLRTRTSGSSGSGRGENEVEDHNGGESEPGHGGHGGDD